MFFFVLSWVTNVLVWKLCIFKIFFKIFYFFYFQTVVDHIEYHHAFNCCKVNCTHNWFKFVVFTFIYLTFILPGIFSLRFITRESSPRGPVLARWRFSIVWREGFFFVAGDLSRPLHTDVRLFAVFQVYIADFLCYTNLLWQCGS